MRFKIVAIDKIRSKELRKAFLVYSGRLSHPYQLEVVELKPCTKPNYTDDQVVADEGERILKVISDDRTVVILDERGESLTSREFARWIDAQAIAGQSQVTFVIGGACGLSDDVRSRGTKVLRLSKMTMLHEFARVFLVEQIYRATTILSGHPYHK